MSDEFNRRVGRKRIADRQMSELVGIALGVTADGLINRSEVEFLHRWLTANLDTNDHPFLVEMYQEVERVLGPNASELTEADLLEKLERLSRPDFELGETLKATSLPYCDPAPSIRFEGVAFCLTGTFLRGGRKICEQECTDRGGSVGRLSRGTDVLVIGEYATSSWKHGSFGNKIEKAVIWRKAGHPIAIVSEKHWTSHLA